MIYSSALIKKLNMVMVRIDEVYHEAAVRLGLSDSAMWILYALAQSEKGLTQTQLSVMCGISKQTINSSVAKLLKEGFLEMRTGVRNSPLGVTKKGENLIREKISRLIDAENAAINAWTSKEQEQFLRYNEEYLERLKKQVETFQNPAAKQ